MFHNAWLLYDAPDGDDNYGTIVPLGMLGLAYWDELSDRYLGAITRQTYDGQDRDMYHAVRPSVAERWAKWCEACDAESGVWAEHEGGD